MNYSNNDNKGRFAYPKNWGEVDKFVFKQLHELRIFADDSYSWLNTWVIKIGYEGRVGVIEETMEDSGKMDGSFKDWDPDQLAAWVDEFLEYHRHGYTWVEIDGKLEEDIIETVGRSLSRDLMDQTEGRCIGVRFRTQCEAVYPLSKDLVEKLDKPVLRNMFVRELPLLGFELREDAIKFKLSWTS